MRSLVASPPSFGRPVTLAAGVSLLGFSTAALWPGHTDMPVLGAAAALSVVLIVAAAWAPWNALPAGALLTVPVACDLVVALLRQSQGGTNSGYGPLVAVPVVWSGLMLGRRAVLALSACTTLLFALPIVIEGSPLYPSSGWRGVVIWAVIALVVGFTAERMMRAQERQTTVAVARAHELDLIAETQNAIATSQFDLEAVLATVVREAVRVARADAAVVEIPDGDDLVLRAAAGTGEGHLGFRLPAATAISGLALRTGETLIADDTETDPRVDREACRRLGARSLAVVPLRHDGRAAGVLKVYSATVGGFGPEDGRLLTLLADMIGSALARAELLERLDRLARADALTGVANRRSWYEELERAIARARRSGDLVSVVVLDMNGFKQVNDRQGHAAGDRLLRSAAASWGASLRETDLLGRIGGDEFAVLLEKTGGQTAAQIATRLVDSLRPLRVTAAVGIATWTGHEGAEELVARADAAMYVDKGSALASA